MLPRTTSSVGSVWCRARGFVPARACSMAEVKAAAANRPFSAASWCTVVRSRRRATGLSSKPTTDRSPGTVSPRWSAARTTPEAMTSEKHSTAVGRSELSRSGVATSKASSSSLSSTWVTTGSMPVASRTSSQPGHALPLRMTRARSTTMAMRRCPRSTRCCAAARAPPRSSTLIVVIPFDRVLVDEHQRELPPLQPLLGGRIAVTGVDEGAVHGDVAGGHHVVVLGRRQERQRQARRRELADDGTEERRRQLVGEGVLERVGEEHADRPGGATGERSRRGVGADVAELVGDGEDALAELVGELVGAGEGVGDGHPAHAEPVGDRLQRHPRHPATLPGRVGRRRRPRRRSGWTGAPGRALWARRGNERSVTSSARRVAGLMVDPYGLLYRYSTDHHCTGPVTSDTAWR